MAQFQIPVIWENWGMVHVEADTLEEAIHKVDEDSEGFRLPECNYIDGSWTCDKEGLMKMFDEETKTWADYIDGVKL